MAALAKSAGGIAPGSRAAFDYTALDPRTAELVRASAHQIHSNAKRVGSMIISIGAALNDVKALVEHGQFLDWLEAEVGMSARSAQRYMQAATLKDKSDTVSYLPPTTIYAITASSTPEPVRTEIVQRIEAGERLGDEAIRDMIHDAKTEAKQERAAAKLTPAQKKQRKQREAKREAEWQKQREERLAEDERRQLATQQAAALIADTFGAELPGLINLLEQSEERHSSLLRALKD